MEMEILPYTENKLQSMQFKLHNTHISCQQMIQNIAINMENAWGHFFSTFCLGTFKQTFWSIHWISKTLYQAYYLFIKLKEHLGGDDDDEVQGVEVYGTENKKLISRLIESIEK